ncbi:MAG: hypothetical protein LUG84_03950 [Akkermansiaceae bacterium]|nr:hypothetical protein [Akkermansiaceae bacterium]
MKSYTPSLIGWAALFPIFCSTIIDKSFQFPKFVYIILGAALFIGQFASLLWGLGGSIVNARKKNDRLSERQIGKRLGYAESKGSRGSVSEITGMQGAFDYIQFNVDKWTAPA